MSRTTMNSMRRGKRNMPSFIHSRTMIALHYAVGVEAPDGHGLPFLRQRGFDARVTGQHQAEEEDAVGGHDRDRGR